MNFHETICGRRFFDAQLPHLIKALERIAESLSAPKQSLSADFVADPDFLHDLYYGDYEPSVFKTQSEHQKQLNHNASMAEELLRQKMGNSPEAMAAFEAYQLAAGERDGREGVRVGSGVLVDLARALDAQCAVGDGQGNACFCFQLVTVHVQRE